jgi:hypothetical protein
MPSYSIDACTLDALTLYGTYLGAVAGGGNKIGYNGKVAMIAGVLHELGENLIGSLL